MQEIVSILILGIVQGLTEFLPISSSGHLLLIPILSDSLNTGLDFSFQDTRFDIALHIATFLAIIIYYKKDVYKLLNFKDLSQDVQRSRRNLIITAIPSLLLGGAIFLTSDELFKSQNLAIFMLIFVGILLIIIDNINLPEAKLNNYSELTAKNAFFIGLFQSISLIRGTSRSGITLIGGLSQGLNKASALKYSFLASLPLFAVLTIVEILSLSSNSTDTNYLFLFIGFITAFLTSLIVLRIFEKLILKKYSLTIFGIYRILVGIFLIVTLNY